MSAPIDLSALLDLRDTYAPTIQHAALVEGETEIALLDASTPDPHHAALVNATTYIELRDMLTPAPAMPPTIAGEVLVYLMQTQDGEHMHAPRFEHTIEIVLLDYDEPERISAGWIDPEDEADTYLIENYGTRNLVAAYGSAQWNAGAKWGIR